MKEKLKPFGILILLITGLLSCEKNNSDMEFYWLDTACANPWNENSMDTNEETIKHVTEYLEENNIDVKEVSIKKDPDAIQFCEACNCTTGDVIVMTVPSKNEKKMLDLMFSPYE